MRKLINKEDYGKTKYIYFGYKIYEYEYIEIRLIFLEILLDKFI